MPGVVLRSGRLHKHVRKRKVPYVVHIYREHGCQITKTVVDGYVKERRRRGRPRKLYTDNIKQWTKVTIRQWVRAAVVRWKEIVRRWACTMYWAFSSSDSAYDLMLKNSEQLFSSDKLHGRTPDGSILWR